MTRLNWSFDGYNEWQATREPHEAKARLEAGLPVIYYRIKVEWDGQFSVSRSDMEADPIDREVDTLKAAKQFCEEMEDELCQKT